MDASILPIIGTRVGTVSTGLAYSSIGFVYQLLNLLSCCTLRYEQLLPTMGGPKAKRSWKK